MRDLHPRHAPKARDGCGNANHRPRGLSSMVLARAEGRLSRASSKELCYTTDGFGGRQPSWKPVARSVARQTSSSPSPSNSSRRQRGTLEPHQEQPEEDDQSYEAAAHNKTPIIPDRLTAKAAPFIWKHSPHASSNLHLLER